MNTTQKILTLSTVLILALSLGGITLASATPENAQSRRGGALASLLNENQLEELHTQIAALREQGANFTEIRAYVLNYLEEQGIEYEAPVCGEERVQLAQQIRTRLHEMTEDGTTLDQIRQRIREYAQNGDGLGIFATLRQDSMEY